MQVTKTIMVQPWSRLSALQEQPCLCPDMLPRPMVFRHAGAQMGHEPAAGRLVSMGPEAKFHMLERLQPHLQVEQ